MACRLRRLALGAGLVLCSAPLLAQDAHDWLQRMAQSLRETDYRGVLVYSQGAQLHAVQVHRSGAAEAPRERLVSLDGELRDVSRDGHHVICQTGGNAALNYATSGVNPILADVEQLELSYRMELGEQDRVAGMAVQIVTIEPRDAFRYGQRLWLETSTGLPLRNLLFGADGRIVSQSMFAQIALGAQSAAEAIDGCGTDSVAARSPMLESQQASRWSIRDLPAGFRLLRTLHDVARPGAEHHVYGDGLAAVSVYFEPRNALTEPLSGATQRGSLSLFGRALGAFHVTVVGEVPGVTVERLAQGVVDSRAQDG